MAVTSLPDIQSQNYDSDFLASHYDRDDGWLILPVMRSDGAPKRLRMHGPVGYRVVRFAYKKRGTPPIFPAIGLDTPSGDKFIAGSVAVGAPILGGNEDQFDYSVTGQYDYLQGAPVDGSRPAGVRGSADDFQAGQKPYDTAVLNAIIYNLNTSTLKTYDPDNVFPNNAPTSDDLNDPNRVYYGLNYKNQNISLIV